MEVQEVGKVQNAPSNQLKNCPKDAEMGSVTVVNPLPKVAAEKDYPEVNHFDSDPSPASTNFDSDPSPAGPEVERNEFPLESD